MPELAIISCSGRTSRACTSNSWRTGLRGLHPVRLQHAGMRDLAEAGGGRVVDLEPLLPEQRRRRWKRKPGAAVTR